ncbi:MAG: hypothetical protein ABWZ15_08225 [Acidimicrobiia bacterium]
MESLRQLLDPTYLAALDARTLDDLRSMRAECHDLEHAVSYYRRLAQGRIEILDAERSRRDRGGSLEDLVADLPRILGAEPGRASATDARIASAETPPIELVWTDGRQELVADNTLANLPGLDDEELSRATDDLREFERELSDVRRELHGVLDALDREVAERQVAGTP